MAPGFPPASKFPVQTHIVLFRGINVGGNNILPMKALVSLLEDLGATQVRTYIQSGNAVFLDDVTDSPEFSRRLSAAIREHHGFEPQVLILSLDALDQALASNPFPEAVADPTNLHLGFLAAAPERPDLEKLAALGKAGERFHLDGRVFYLHAPDGVGRSKLAANAEKLLGVPMTNRNWRTVCKVRELANLE